MNKDRHLLLNRIVLIFYCPLSCLLVGLLAVYIGRIGPSCVVVMFQGGLLQNTLPFPGYPGYIQLPGLLFGFCAFILAAFLGSSSRPLISVFQVRVFLIILIWLITFPVNAVVLSASRGAELETWIRLIFTAVHLNIAFLATFLPSLKSDKSTCGWTATRAVRRASIRMH